MQDTIDSGRLKGDYIQVLFLFFRELTMGVAHHELLNMVTVKQIRRAVDSDGAVRTHPLWLLSHEKGTVICDYSKLTVPLPLSLRSRGKTELDHMLEPVQELCERAGLRLPAGEWEYPWYFFELLDRDGKVSPLCWVTPQLLYITWPDDRQHAIQRIRDIEMEIPPRYAYELQQMDMVAHEAQTDAAAGQQGDQWREWLIALWREHESAWIENGDLTYEPIDPWCQMLDFDERLVESNIGGRWFETERSPSVPRWLQYAGAGHPGLYWRMLPLYDAREAGLIWEAMKEVLYLTSVFNPAAKDKQDKAVWKRLQQRFPMRYERMSRYRYRSRLREQKVLDWSREGKTVDEMAALLLDEGYHPLHEATARAAQGMQAVDRHLTYLDSARSTVVRIRRHLRADELIGDSRRGRPKKSTE